MTKQYSRRQFLMRSAAGLAGASAAAVMPMKIGGRDVTQWGRAPHLRSAAHKQKFIILGFDGLDPHLVQRFVDEGILPTFKRMIERGHFSTLGTTMPPQSPVAWASFITGTNPGGNGIFDFVHRDPATFTPYLSTSRSFGSDKKIELGNWTLPLESGRVELMRGGTPFWSLLEEHGISTSVFKIPSNFPVVPSATRSVSGMGTPDVLGTYGTFTYFTDTDVPGSEDFTGGRVVKVIPRDHTFTAAFTGPKNEFRKDIDRASVDIAVHRDPWEPVVRIKVQDTELVLREGEWSGWVPLRFEFMPLFASVSGMVRFYVQEVHPHIRLYASPINIDPKDPMLPISSPADYSGELADAVGRFYTQGFPEDTKALSHGIFSSEEFLVQSKSVLAERMKAFDYELSHFHDGLMFFYFSSVDQNSHMLWRTMHPDHPLYEPNASPAVKNALRYYYQQFDEVLRKALGKADANTTLMVVSDHGFAPFTREFNVSTWLIKHGFMVLTDPSRMEDSKFYNFVDWSRTKAYALGLNGVYLNLRGREKRGSVEPHQAQAVKNEIIAKLSEERDPQTGQKILTQAYDSQKLYSGPYVSLAADIILGYRRGYRISDESVLGKFPGEIVSDRTDPWSADHCSDPAVVPGVLLTNREIQHPSPHLWDMAPSILASYGINVPPQMDGKNAFKA